MPYKLYYFNLTGRAETARMLFKVADQEFEDIRIEREDWPELKKKFIMGQMPVLEVDGVQLSQSNAINRYVARQCGLAGESAMDQAQVDMIVDCIGDIGDKMKSFLWEKDAEIKAAAVKKFKEEGLIPGFSQLQKLLEQNNGGNGFFVGDGITTADIAFFNAGALVVPLVQGDIWSQFSKLSALFEKVKNNPKISAWIKERPGSVM